MNLIYLIITILTIFSLLKIVRVTTPASEIFQKGYGNKEETITTLLDRIEYNNNYKGRLNIYYRFFLESVIIALISSIIIINKIPKAITLLQLIFIVWIILVLYNGYFEYHADKFPAYAIKKNLNHIRHKLNCKKKLNSLTDNKYKFKHSANCYLFNYNTLI